MVLWSVSSHLYLYLYIQKNGDCSPPPVDVTTLELINNNDASESIEEVTMCANSQTTYVYQCMNAVLFQEVNQNVRRSQRSRTRVNYSELSGIAPVKKEDEDDDQEVPSG